MFQFKPKVWQNLHSTEQSLQGNRLLGPKTHTTWSGPGRREVQHMHLGASKYKDSMIKWEMLQSRIPGLQF